MRWGMNDQARLGGDPATKTSCVSIIFEANRKLMENNISFTFIRTQGEVGEAVAPQE